MFTVNNCQIVPYTHLSPLYPPKVLWKVYDPKHGVLMGVFQNEKMAVKYASFQVKCTRLF